MKPYILAGLMAPMAVMASERVLQSRTVTQTAVAIQERDQVRAEVVPSVSGGRKCMVIFMAPLNPGLNLRCKRVTM